MMVMLIINSLLISNLILLIDYLSYFDMERVKNINFDLIFNINYY